MTVTIANPNATPLGFIDDVLTGRITLPMVPRVVEQVLQSLRREDFSTHDVAEQIAQDPVLSSRVLRLANSGYYARGRQLSSIAEAISIIGVKALQTLVAVSGSMAAFVDTPGVNLRHFWLRAVITGNAARQLAARSGNNADAAYSGGLLQGIGHLILCQCHPDKARQGFSPFVNEWGLKLAAREVSVFGIAHPEISALWVDKLGMPQLVADAVLTSLYPVETAAPALARILRLACTVADAVAEGRSLDTALAELEPILVAQLGLQDYLGSEEFSTDFAELQTLPGPL